MSSELFMLRVSVVFLLFLILLCCGPGQVPDDSYQPVVKNPAYSSTEGPTVLIDEAHYNLHTAGGSYQAFAKLLRLDGCIVKSSTGVFSRELLNTADILVISNALNKTNADRSNWQLPTPSVFSPEEIHVVRNWVHDGGSLFLITDHMPFPGAAHDLALEFGIIFNNGFAWDRDQSRHIIFKRSDGSLNESPHYQWPQYG
jgi:hypothetical protein